MLLYVPKNVTGADFGLVINNGTFKKCLDNKKPKDAIEIPSNEYYDIRKLYNLPYRFFPPERFRKPYETILKQKGVRLPWKNIIPHTIYQKELLSFIRSLSEDFKDLDISYYKNYFSKQKNLFRSFENASIEIETFDNFRKETSEAQSSGAILKTFTPTRQTHGVWKAGPIFYDRFSTVTGRLTVKSGPNILLLKKEFRKCLTSQWGDDGAIYFLDYKSLEPRLLLALKNPDLEIPKDPYLYASVSMGVDGKIDRKHIKTAIISMIYGAGDHELVKQLRPYIPFPEDFIASVKEQFGVEDLKEKIKAEYELRLGKEILNYYERPIFADGKAPYVLVNYFIQSTAVDVALFGFSSIVNKLLTTGAIELIKPQFVLHDALILDVHNSVAGILPKLTNLGSKNIPRFENTKFWLQIEKLK